MKRLLWYIPLLCLALLSCESRLTDDPSLTVTLSADTVLFDTVFTCAGSATRTIIVRNPHKRALLISDVSMQYGESFRINLDGEQNTANLKDIRLDGGDSLFLFVRATIDPADRTSPLLVEDNVIFRVGDCTTRLNLQAYGWDVNLIDSLIITSDTMLTAQRPYLVRHWLLVDSTATLTIEPGAHFYMHDNAQIACYGGLVANGTADAPILFSSDRLDDIYDSIPYIYVGGKWDGIYAVRPDTISLQHVDIISGNVGLYLLGSGQEHLTVTDSRIHNQSLYGMILQDVDALIANTEISNCAEYCLYLSGGRYELVHTTIASYFNATAYNIQTTSRNDSISPLYINNLSKTRRRTEVHFLNSLLAGAKRNCLMLATPLAQYYTGEFAYSYMQTDTLDSHFAHDMAYGQRGDTLFVCNYYSERSQYYDFHLDSLSHARDIADPTIAARYPLDRNGRNRLADGKPDAGCYEYEDR